MTIVLDAGTLVAMERLDRDLAVLIKRERLAGRPPLTHGAVVGQVWRDAKGRQANLSRISKRVDMRPLDERSGRRAGELLGRAGTADVIDAAVVLLACNGNEIYTSDADDLRHLAGSADLDVDIIPI